MKRKTRGRKLKKQRKMMLIGIISLMLSLSTGYAAFSTNISLNAKGIILSTPEECFTVSDNGNGTGTIEDYNKTCGSKVKIPKTINNLTITKIANTNSTEQRAFYNKGISTIIFPDTLTIIGNWSFYNNNLTNVKVPDNVTSIGANAFRTNKISYLYLGKNVQAIYGHAFSTNLITTLTLPNSVKSLSNLAFSDNYLTSVEIPKSVTMMGGGVFSNNSFPEENPIVYGKNPDGTTDYTTIDSYARREVTNYQIPNTIKRIGMTAFGYKKVGTIEIPSSVEKIESYAFASSQLVSITLNEGLQTIGGYSFADNKFTEITIPSTVTSIGDNAFSSNAIKTINIHKSKNSVLGSPWGATNATINWIGSE